MNAKSNFFIDTQSANDEVYQLFEIYPHQVELVGSSAARVTVHGGDTKVVIYLMESEPREMGEILKMRHKPLPEWFCSRVTTAVISSAIREI